MSTASKARHRAARRRFLLKLMGLLAGGWAAVPIFSPPPRALARATSKIVLPPGTDPRTLTGRNPRELDTRNLEVMPLADFKTMGLSDHRIDHAAWRLTVAGNVRETLSLTWAETKRLPAVEKNVLLICPGVFCNHGRWRGVSIRALFEAAGADPNATHVTVRGPLGPYQKTHRLPLSDVADDRAFLAYAVNGEPLPVKHGSPLRLVSANDYGFDWVKYVEHIEVDIIAA
jgi:sulfoxide reductase catalytic subunit YedY